METEKIKELMDNNTRLYTFNNGVFVRGKVVMIHSEEVTYIENPPADPQEPFNVVTNSSVRVTLRIPNVGDVTVPAADVHLTYDDALAGATQEKINTINTISKEADAIGLPIAVAISLKDNTSEAVAGKISIGK
jgi:hypothetical protein